MARPMARPPQARRIRPTGPAARRATPSGAPAPEAIAEPRPLILEGLRRDAPRLAVAGLSAIIPGLGQLANGRRRLALAFMVPTLVLVAVALVLVTQVPRMRLLASLIVPSTLDTLLALNVVLLVWRLVAVGQAFLDRRPRTIPSRWGISGLLLLGLLVALPHAAVNLYGGMARDAFGLFFAPTTRVGALTGGPGVTGGQPATPDEQGGPGPNERLNVLIIGLDKTTNRTATLTDSMIVASLDPTLGTISMVSVPRDMIGVPLGDGRTYGPKLNSLYSYAARNPKDFPEGPTRTLENAVGALLGIPINYYVTTDFYGFVRLIDALGGVDIVVDHGFTDPMYDGWDGASHGHVGFSITAGPHHLDGLTALAYARSRYAPGESDFKRAARQQQILVAIKDKLMSGGNLLFRSPDLLRAVGDTVRTDVPPDRLPDLAGIADTFGSGDKVVRTVIDHPFVRGTTRAPYGSVQVPDLAAIRELAAHLFPPVGTPASLWTPGQAAASPAPSPWSAPSPSAAP
jgi:LCP family protein required for cell wall assembly